MIYQIFEIVAFSLEYQNQVYCLPKKLRYASGDLPAPLTVPKAGAIVWKFVKTLKWCYVRTTPRMARYLIYIIRIQQGLLAIAQINESIFCLSVSIHWSTNAMWGDNVYKNRDCKLFIKCFRLCCVQCYMCRQL